MSENRRKSIDPKLTTIYRLIAQIEQVRPDMSDAKVERIKTEIEHLRADGTLSDVLADAAQASVDGRR